MTDARNRGDRWQRGMETFTRLNGASGTRFLQEMESVAPELVRQVIEFGYGEAIGNETTFPLRDRQLVTISVLTAMGGAEPQLESHINIGLDAGLTPREVIEAMTHAALFCGFPRALNAVAVAKRAFDKRGVAPAG